MFSRRQSELVLLVEDVERARAFYQDVVGLKLHEGAPQGHGWAWFWTGEPGKSSWLAVREKKAGPLAFEEFSPQPPEHRWGPVHLAFEVPRAQAEEAAAHVRAKNIPVYGPVRLEWMRANSWYFHDPDGNLVEWWSPDPE